MGKIFLAAYGSTAPDLPPTARAAPAAPLVAPASASSPASATFVSFASAAPLPDTSRVAPLRLLRRRCVRLCCLRLEVEHTPQTCSAMLSP